MRLILVALSAAMLIGAAPTPAPAPKKDPPPPPKAFTFGGFVRNYYFTRTNDSGYGLPQSTNVNNQATDNAALHLRAGYAFSKNWSAAGTYVYANPLNGCNTALQQLQTGGPCSGFKIPSTNPDNTLPAFGLSTFYEAYLKYNTNALAVKAGNMLLTTPWANGADTRLKPEAYQGVDATAQLTRRWSTEAAYIDRFESRVDSAFVNTTLLTATNQADAPGPGSNLLFPKYYTRTSAGFGYFKLGFLNAGSNVAANAHFYSIFDIANIEWFDAKWTISQKTKTFLAAQGGSEENAGKSYIGLINSQAIGLQGGISPTNMLDLTLGFDYLPPKTQTGPLPAGVSCAAIPVPPLVKTPAGDQITVKGTTPFNVFLPTGGSPNCINDGHGIATVLYGGWASPYTDSYTGDPLYTTSMTGGMIERRSPGLSGKATGTWYGVQRRFRLITSFAMYAYGNKYFGIAPSRETDIDGTYYFNHPASGGAPYKGFLLRHRYGDRDMKNVALYGGLPVFKYNRTQLEYDF